MVIKRIYDDFEKRTMAGNILEALPEWFSIPESRDEYVRDSQGKCFFAAYDDSKPVGFIYLKQTGKDTAELAVIGVLKEYHRKGIGKKLFEAVKNEAKKSGFSFLQVKTVQMGKYDEYDRTNMFYISLGFKEFEIFPALWDEQNPCQIYIMAL